MESAASMSNIGRCIALCSTSGVQSNEWKFAASKAIREDSMRKNDVARIIRSEREKKTGMEKPQTRIFSASSNVLIELCSL